MKHTCSSIDNRCGNARPKPQTHSRANQKSSNARQGVHPIRGEHDFATRVEVDRHLVVVADQEIRSIVADREARMQHFDGTIHQLHANRCADPAQQKVGISKFTASRSGLAEIFQDHNRFRMFTSPRKPNKRTIANSLFIEFGKM